MGKIKRKIKLIIVLLFCILTTVCGFTVAKYTSNSIWDYYLNSRGFYFSSDYLGTTEIKNADSLWDGNSVHFNLKNTINSAVVTNYDISYDVSCSLDLDAEVYADCYLNGLESSSDTGVITSSAICINNTLDMVDVSAYDEETCNLGGYDWTYQEVINDLYFDVELTNQSYEIDDVIAYITVTSSDPFVKTIQGSFNLNKVTIDESNVNLEFNEQESHDRLIVSNSNPEKKCVKVNWDSNNLILDSELSNFSSYAVDASGFVNEIIFSIDAKETLDYIFYERISGTYSTTDFTITDDYSCQ